MTSQEIHGYIRKIAFKDISYNNINNIIRSLERKGYRIIILIFKKVNGPKQVKNK